MFFSDISTLAFSDVFVCVGEKLRGRGDRYEQFQLLWSFAKAKRTPERASIFENKSVLYIMICYLVSLFYIFRTINLVNFFFL